MKNPKSIPLSQAKKKYTACKSVVIGKGISRRLVKEFAAFRRIWGKNRNEREVAEMANKKGSRQLTWTDRISIEALKKAGHSVIEIAEQLGVHRSTIYNELKRGEYMHRNSDYTETLSYSQTRHK